MEVRAMSGLLEDIASGISVLIFVAGIGLVAAALS